MTFGDRTEQYELVQAASPEDWRFLHSLRRSELFERKEGVIYNTNHPDDRAPNHFPLVLKFQGRHVGTARLDILKDDVCDGVVRLVAIVKEEQRRGHGRVLMELFENLARFNGVDLLLLYAHLSAVGFYEKLNFIHEDWIDPTGAVVEGLVPMTKKL